jgi:hypothetical protein
VFTVPKAVIRITFGRVQRLGGAQHVHAVAAAHLQVAEDDVVLSFVQLLDGDVSVGGFIDVVLRVGERPHNSAAE